MPDPAPLLDPDILDIGRAADHLEEYLETRGDFFDRQSCQRVIEWLREKERAHYGRRADA